MKCLFVSDIHGKKKKYRKLFEIVRKESPEGLFIGGDILPQNIRSKERMNDFVEKFIFEQIKEIKSKKDLQVFLIMGNDDPRAFEDIFIDADEKDIINYVHNKSVKFGKFYVIGYAYIPPTPFQLKDWEKYDVSRYVDIGAVPPEEGTRTVEPDRYEVKYTTIEDDLEELSKLSPPEKTIFLFHAPPYDSNLDRADLDDKKIDHVPLDVHVGSIAIQRFIKDKEPFLTLHGHAHESPRITGSWKERYDKTLSFSAAHDGNELAVVRFDTDNIKNAERELIEIG
ncbi:MAG: metallophosphoesterase family protein [Thermoplasmatota archaeon]